ncbi:Uncharacterized protein TPAR_06089 [Tolypocladium paradoxum]|uniref:Uncharacterized protein n=1 Tax=Tolypocladium paradoxum TaxID=94208 RepID=A0A2S4KU23_9HYPO|nr:Uncharacterized protein TPAR_06089 [Tolypocladium paradoxum]
MAILFADGNGDELCNTVASTGTVSTTMVASWQDRYQITGTTQTFVAGQPVLPPQGAINTISFSSLEPITYQQEYVMPAWGNCAVRDNQSLPKSSFGLKKYSRKQ